MMEPAIVGELAHVRGEDVDALVSKLHEAHKRFGADAPKRPPEPKETPPVPPVKAKGYEYIGEIAVASEKLTVGEAAARAEDTVTLRARRGSWYAYERGGNDGRPSGLVLVHSDALKTFEKANLEGLGRGERGRRRHDDGDAVGAARSPGVRRSLRVPGKPHRRRQSRSS